MIQARVVVDRDFEVGEIDRRLFGTFVEHIGRCVYGGIYEPGHPSADDQGFRGDVIELTRELGVTVVRYPGGNFLSGYRWEDGVGPLEQRPRQLDLAWFATEPNTFGTNEFIDWCRKVGVEPMFCVNLGTRGPDEARQFIEYCNHPGGTVLSELRKQHGYPEPHGIRLWGLGNEQDGPWQIGEKSAFEYGRIAKETAKLMRWLGPAIELSACGSSNADMKTFGAWEYEVLEQCYDQVDLLSLHQYFAKTGDDSYDFQTAIDAMDRYIEQVVAICDAVGAKRRSGKKIMLSFDEYNVWYKARQTGMLDRPKDWPVGPAFNEEIYNHEDALVLGGAMIALLNHCDRVKVACLAQLVNVIAPIMTETGGAAWRQPIFFPFADASRIGHGRVLRQATHVASFATRSAPAAPYLLSTVVANEDDSRISILALNRHLGEAMNLRLSLRGFEGQWQVMEATELVSDDLMAVNTAAAPDRVAPRALGRVSVSGSDLTAELAPASWNVIVLERV
jgi:alpha-N-arabinofuranosidase